MEATLKQLDTPAWFPALARRDYHIGANLTAGGFDDPDAYLYENSKCGSSRKYTDYCSDEMDRLIDLQSQELDRTKRLKLVYDIQRKLETEVARPMLGWRKEYFVTWPHVRNLVLIPSGRDAVDQDGGPAGAGLSRSPPMGRRPLRVRRVSRVRP
jgi:peptide/nickel transport system substrate-binding protein